MTQTGTSSGIFPTSTSSIPGENVASSSATTLDVTNSIASLRDAALKTLRPKRKKATKIESVPIPTRPLLGRAAATPASVFLNYGDEEQASASTTAVEVQKTSSDSKSKDDDDAREEGEISDEEDPKTVLQTTILKGEATETRGDQLNIMNLQRY
jgi:hypothetical protein